MLGAFDFVNDPGWAFVLGVATLGAFLFGGLGFALALRGRARKRLSWRVDASPLVSVHRRIDPGERDEVRVYFGDELIENLQVASVEIANTGTAPITRDDFEGPLLVAFEGTTRVLSARTGDDSAGALQPRIDFEGQRVTAEGVLLNPGDAFMIRTLCSELEPDRIAMRARVAGAQVDHQQGVTRFVTSDGGTARWGYSARYHAASLAAVYLALAVGILIGVGFGADLPNK